MDNILKLASLLAATNITNEAKKFSTSKDESKTDIAMKIARENKELFDAHIKLGFTEEQAIQIVIAQNN